MRTLMILLVSLAVLTAACGGTETATTTATTSADNTLETLPPTSTTPPPATTTTVDPIAAEYGTPMVTGTPLPPVGASPDPAVGEAAPVSAGAGYDGTEVTLGGGGDAQAVLFVAHWCPHCQDELPEVVRWLDQTGGVDGVEFVLVTVAVDPARPNFPPSSWIEREGWDGPILLDDAENSTFFAYGGSSIPLWVFINPDGTVASRVAGAIGVDEVENILADMAIAP